MTRIKISRMEEIIKKELSHILQYETKDPRLGFVTVTGVKLTGDLSIANVYISVLGDKEEREKTFLVLNNAKGYLRTEIAKRIDMKHTPKLILVCDDTLDYGKKIDDLISHISKKREFNEGS